MKNMKIMKLFEIFRKRKMLPIWQHKKEFLRVLKANQTVILVGEIGNGKTTQIPQFVLEAFGGVNNVTNNKIIACTQPRRAAAISVSRRVTQEMDVKIGKEIGYSIRFEDCCSSKTVIKYLTYGVLLKEAMADPLLEQYKVIILDEAYERILATNVLFGVLKGVMKKRVDLKLVVISATIEAEKFQNFFFGAPLIKVPHRLHPDEIFYPVELEKNDLELVNQKDLLKKNYMKLANQKVLEIHMCEPLGDVLGFLTRGDEIDYACSKIERNLGTRKPRCSC